MAERDLAAVPQHLIGVGPWAEGITWSVGSLGLKIKSNYPAHPLAQLPNPTGRSFTLRKSGAAEATLDFSLPRGSGLIVDEMVTDIWWRRRDIVRQVTSPIGRFQVSSCVPERSGDQVTTSITAVDYRGILEDRLIYTPHTYAAGTVLSTILFDTVPDNSGVLLNRMDADAPSLGALAEPLTVEAGQSVGDVLEAARAASRTTWDWGVELEGNDRVLRVWPTSRGTDRQVVLADLGTGYTPMQTWARKTEPGQYANSMYFSGRDYGQVAQIDTAFLPMGQRDARDSNPNLITASLIAKAAQDALAKRAQLQQGWTIGLMPGFWEGRGHIDVGDWVTVVVRMGSTTIRERHQVEEIDVKIDSNGTEAVTLELGLARVSANPRSRYSIHSRIVKQIRNLARRTQAP